MLKTLIKIRFKGLFANQMRASKKSKTGGAGRIVLMVLLFAYIAVVFSAMFGMMFSSLIEPLHLMGIDWLYFALMGIMVVMLCFIGSVFLVQHELYEAKDNHLLLSMPIKNKDILLSRIFVVLILNYAYELLIAGPAFVVYIMNVPINAIQIFSFLVVIITLPLLVLAISAVFGWLMEHIMQHVRKKNIVTLVLSLAFFGVYFYAVSSIQNYIALLIQNGKSIAQAIEQGLFPIYHLAIAIQDGNLLSLLLYLVCVIIPFAIVIYVLSRSFIKLATREAKVKKIEYVEKPMQSSSMSKALFMREVKHFTSNAMVMLNGAMGIIMTLIAAAALVIYKDDIQILINMMPAFKEYVAPVLCIAGVTIGCLNIITASSVSLEGNQLWVIKSLPVNAINILNAKLALHLVLCIPAGVIFSVVASILFGLNMIDAIIVILTPVIFTTLIALFGLLMNLWKPKFDWVNETACAKQSMPVVITMFASMGLAFVLVGGYLGLMYRFVALDIYTYAVIVICIIADVLLYYLLKTWGTKKFNQL